jgi:hypothetical protein
MKSKDLCGVAQAPIKIGFKIVDESEYEPPARIPVGLIEKLSKKCCLPRARARNNKLLAALRRENACHSIAELLFYAACHDAILRHAVRTGIGISAPRRSKSLPSPASGQAQSAVGTKTGPSRTRHQKVALGDRRPK